MKRPKEIELSPLFDEILNSTPTEVKEGVSDLMNENSGMKPFWKTKQLQVRWNEPLGLPECPYAYRWVFILFGYSIRIHKWLRSDDKRYMHDHAWNFRTFVLRGSYYDVSEKDGVITRELVTTTAYRDATHKHYVEIPETGAWTLLFCSKPWRKWGFWVNGKSYRPLRFFSRHGHPACDEQ